MALPTASPPASGNDRAIAHIRHAQIARRATLSQYFDIAEIGESEIDLAPARLATRDVTANRHET